LGWRSSLLGRLRHDGAMAYSQTCPRCGADFTGDDKGPVADAVVEHAATAHHHALDREVVLAHLEGVRPGDRDVE
jgi:hypothetical protein